MRFWKATETFGPLVGAVLAVGIVATAAPAHGLDFDFEEVRSWGVPQGFSLGQSIIRSSEGTTLVAATAGQGATATCTVVVASAESARAFPYRHSPQGSQCVGALEHPDGGFFVRGFRAGAEEGDVAGFTARIDGAGRERWLLPDTEVAESSEFQGTYRRPHPALAYSVERDRLLTFTVGRLELGMLDRKEITHASVIADGTVRVRARTLGSSRGSGIVGGVAALDGSGDFLVYVFQPTTEGARFFTYDGRQTVEAFEPLEEDWTERFVRRMIYGPDGNVYLLWTEDQAKGQPTRVTVVDTTAAEVWSETYSPSARLDGETRELGSPRTFWVGASHVFVLYPSDPVLVRVIDASTGEEEGIAQLTGATEHRPLAFVRGPEGNLRLLAVDSGRGRFLELRVGFGTGEGAGDAGLSDGGFRDAGPDRPSGGAGGGNGGCGGGCFVPGSAESAPQSVAWIALLVALAAVCRPLGRR